jgi:hypothetical protein
MSLPPPSSPGPSSSFLMGAPELGHSGPGSWLFRPLGSGRWVASNPDPLATATAPTPRPPATGHHVPSSFRRRELRAQSSELKNLTQICNIQLGDPSWSWQHQ